MIKWLILLNFPLTIAAQSDSIYSEVHGSGDTTIIFESGMAGTHDEWDGYLDSLKSNYTLFTYDRAGIGRSLPTNRPRTIPQMVAELRDELTEQNLQPPFLLVGHSMGSYVSRYFVEEYPDEVIGLVLIDPSPERLYDEYTEEEMNDFISFGNEAMSDSPEGDIAEWESYLNNREYVRGTVAPDNIPVVILSATQWDFWEYHEDYLNKNPDSKHLKMEASHAIHKERREEIVALISKLLRD
ncbi:MAG: alpha/beta hydrolase [Flavobacteriia bacterium]|nr:alpha/beta hydrolase [Flavobacteriia bacterium]